MNNAVGGPGKFPPKGMPRMAKGGAEGEGRQPGGPRGIDDRMGALMARIDELSRSGDPAASEAMAKFDEIDTRLGEIMGSIDDLEKTLGKGGKPAANGGEGGEGEGGMSDEELDAMLADITGKGGKKG